MPGEGVIGASAYCGWAWSRLSACLFMQSLGPFFSIYQKQYVCGHSQGMRGDTARALSGAAPTPRPGIAAWIGFPRKLYGADVDILWIDAPAGGVWLSAVLDPAMREMVALHLAVGHQRYLRRG